MDTILSGIDLVSIERMREASRKEAFLRRVFTAGELEYARRKRRPERHLAGRFAAKEAVMKALSTGVLSGISLKDIEVVNGKDGRPAVRLADAPARLAAGRPVHLSISYTKDMAFAFAAIG